VKSKDDAAEVDVVLLEGNTLYLFECKHSVPATGPHELRDLWLDIKKAGEQLQTAMKILQNPRTRCDYIAGWFPGTRAKESQQVRIKTCILCSHLTFGGYTYEGIPVRDYSSFSLMLNDGEISVGRTDHNRAKMARFCIWANDRLSGADLDDYLSPESRYFSMLQSHMRPVSHMRRLGNVVLANETFVFAVDFDNMEDWNSHIEAYGFQRLPDEEIDIDMPWTLDELDEKLR